ncbi:MAG: tetrahydrofolate dehydrogenase/cyclohydrolase catalytic domain-containing protein [Planctomycetota bacterium]
MPAKVLYVNDLAQGIEKDSITQINGIKERGQSIKVACFLIGDSPADSRFAASRGAACQKSGVDFSVKTFPGDVNPKIVDERLSDASRDIEFSGIIVSTCYDADFTQARSLRRLSALKDIEVDHPENIANILSDAESYPSPPLAAAVNAAFVTHDIDLYKKSVLIIGSKDKFLIPLGTIFLSQSAVIIEAKSLDDVSSELVSSSDVIVCSDSSGKSISAKDIKKGAVLVDAGAPGPGSLSQSLTGGGCFSADIEEKASAVLPAGGLKQLENAFFVHNIMHFARILETTNQNDLKAVINKKPADNNRNAGI